MKILAVEFSSEQRSVAIVEKRADGAAEVRGSANESGGRNANAFALIEEALRRARMEREEISCIAVGLGPGSYTGIRAAIALAQGWQLAREIRLLGIGSVECLAAQAQFNGILGRVNFVIDAQRNEFYLAGYEINASGCHEVEQLHLVTFAEAERRIAEKQTVMGTEANRLIREAQNLFPEAATLGRIACGRTNFVSGEKLEPIYLRETSFVKAPPPRVISD